MMSRKWMSKGKKGLGTGHARTTGKVKHAAEGESLAACQHGCFKLHKLPGQTPKRGNLKSPVEFKDRSSHCDLGTVEKHDQSVASNGHPFFIMSPTPDPPSHGFVLPS